MSGDDFRREFDVRLVRLENQLSDAHVQIARLVESVEGYRGNQEQLLTMMQRMLNRHDEQLNGFQEKPGLVVRLDRVEQREQGRLWQIRTLWAALASGFVAWLFKR